MAAARRSVEAMGRRPSGVSVTTRSTPCRSGSTPVAMVVQEAGATLHPELVFAQTPSWQSLAKLGSWPLAARSLTTRGSSPSTPSTTQGCTVAGRLEATAGMPATVGAAAGTASGAAGADVGSELPEQPSNRARNAGDARMGWASLTGAERMGGRRNVAPDTQHLRWRQP
jgi:hypothetical protein